MKLHLLPLLLIPAACAMALAPGCASADGNTLPGCIIIGENAPPREGYAARELQRYLYQRTGALLPVRNKMPKAGGFSFIIGQTGTNRLIKSMADSGAIKISASDPGTEGYILQTIRYQGAEALIIAGSDEVGCLYGVYGLLDDYYGVGFYPGGDVLPGRRISLFLPDVNERKAPRQKIRGVLPWTNFPQSAGVYSYKDYRFIIDQMAKMRMNFLEIHNYNGMGVHNEMFHNFTLKGLTSRVYMNTARTGHGWAGPAWLVKDYLFKGADLFDDYDFGADCTLHNKSLTNEEAFRKGSSLFQQVISYAHSRGVKVGLGIELDIIPFVYKAKPNDPAVVNARVDQIIGDYPDLDYLLCYRSEVIAPESQNVWQDVFDIFYKRIKAEAPGIRLAVSGWGLAADHVAHLPPDVIAAPIAPYSAGFESGSIYPRREYWGCPWLERDFNSSEHYYPYNMHLSDTIKAYADRLDNMTGFMCLTWRLTDAIDAKMSYIAKAPWDLQDKLGSSRAMYRDYAVKNYGESAANSITDIIDQNEPYAVNAGECEGTPDFTGTDRVKDIQKADEQLAVIDACIRRSYDPGARFRLGLLRDRIASVKAWCELDQSFPRSGWDDLPGAFPAWAMTFRDRVTDISSLGNVVSAQNRLVQLRYLAKENDLRKTQAVKAPSYVEARGTVSGAVITWRNSEPDAAGFNVYRGSNKINKALLPAPLSSYADNVNGIHRYCVTAVSKSGEESAKSVPDTCLAGSAYTEPPNIVVVSPPTSVASGQPLELTARVLDDRVYGSISAAIHYRRPGSEEWTFIPMIRRVRSIFTVKIPSSAIGAEGLEYYITASDGTNTGFYPKSAPAISASVVRYGDVRGSAPSVPANVRADGGSITWSASSGVPFWYRIYRSRKSGFIAGPDTLLTWVHQDTLRFTDLEPGFDGEKLNGRYYYRVSAVDRDGMESRPSRQVSVVHPIVAVSEASSRICEAESAELHNVQVYSDPGASGYNAVGFFGDAAGDSILFPKAPDAKGLTITYSNGTGKSNQCSLYIDGKDALTLDLPDTGGWYAYETLSLTVPVRGSVELRVDADDLAANHGFCANIDCIELR